MGQVAGNAPVPCFGQNFTNFQYTPASTPPPAPPRQARCAVLCRLSRLHVESIRSAAALAVHPACM